MGYIYTFKKVNGERRNLTNLEQHFNYILQYCNYNFYNVGKVFKIQLFDKEYYANDQVDCIAEFDAESIDIVISQAIEWIEEHIAN